MTIVELFLDEAGRERRAVLAAASLAGVANVLVLALVNAASASSDPAEFRVFAMFALGVVLYAVAGRATYHRCVAIVESALHRMKTRIVDKIERADLASIERIGSAEIFDRITENVAVISGWAGNMAHVLQSASISVFACLYLAYVSPTAFVLLALLTAISVSIYRARLRELDGYFQEKAQTRLRFFDSLTDLLRGFKEVKYSRRRGSELRADIVAHSERMRHATVQSGRIFDDNWIFANCSLFALLGTVVFVLPQHVPTDTAMTGTLVAGTMFIWGPLSGIINGVAAFTRSNQALAEIAALEAKLDAAGLESSGPGEDPWGGRFSSIELRGLQYGHAGGTDQGFHIGPIDLTVNAGEVLFIVGGNGSGKTTLVKTLTGLYAPSGGRLLVDGISVDQHNAAAYRELFTTIYSDFHLFSRLYGLADVDSGEVHRLLAQMHLRSQTSFAEGSFTKRELSTGQRKRLAMIVALLEDRPIYVFDEWAADQDPEFRKYFYTELLPTLRARGKTVLAVSHDDRYFSCADRVITMEQGQIRAVQRSAERARP
ncbi:putative ATP-binding cassette transporter [Nannocystis exedens]|uniref:Putative ATP-binding cassette transporter n=1 Tax=Nannocystis exedens TaxID=54 RepID=A0A1I2HMB0_9BACT|nr:cyclic peptide export ABC transporter [Nannocystis exedens]PCC74190.1 ABC transporter ATP-binding protein YojI [Nannocystis exedens]SFF29906.1 putative ATP-binding cassette transporter [Nannocystis exedens]